MLEGKKTFMVTKDHLTLLKRMYVVWYTGEKWGDIGAPGISDKKPYGNSHILLDVAEILGLKVKRDEETDECIFTEEQNIYCMKIHREMKTVLQILVSNCHIKTGVYQSDNICHQEWKKFKT